MILTWRNDPRIRELMYNDHVISPEEHFSWLDRTIASDAAAYFILEAADEPLGIVGFYNMDRRNLKAEWTFHLRPDGAPRGTGSVMGYLALERYFGELGLRKLCSEVLLINSRGLAYHERLGFRREGLRLEHVEKNGSWCDVHELGLLASDWANHAPKLHKELFLA